MKQYKKYVIYIIIVSILTILSSISSFSRSEWEVISFEGWFNNTPKAVSNMLFDNKNNAWIIAQDNLIHLFNSGHICNIEDYPNDAYFLNDTIPWLN